jgi:hypothetical protein
MSLDTFIDKIRVNKFAEFLAATGVYILATETAEVFTTHDFDFSDGVNILIGAFNLGMSLYFARKQNRRYEGIVEGIERQGYDERFCSMYMDHPCGRSVVKTALKRTGNFDEYKELTAKYPLTRLL